MAVVFESGYVLPVSDQPLTHARIAHSGNWLSGGTASASSTASSYSANAPLTSLTYERWKPLFSSATWTYNHGSSQTCDYCIVAGHNIGTAGGTIQCQTGGGSALSPSHNPTDNSPIMFIFEPTASSSFRISVSGGSAPEIGVVKFGRALQMQRAIYGGHAPARLARITETRANESETGEILGMTAQRRFEQTSFEWSHLTAQWVRDNWYPFQQAMEDEPFAIAWRPGTFTEVSYGRSTGPAIPSNMGVRDFMSVTLNFKGQGYA